MINEHGPWLIEYNCRLGDPETEVIIPRLMNDLVLLLKSAAQKRLKEVTIQVDPRSVATVMAVSGGYPGNFEKGKEIKGISGNILNETMIFHAGTTMKDNTIVTNGGRVLAVTSFGNTVREAAEQSTYMLEQVYFEEMNFRTDIGYEFHSGNEK
jgi:phosphoribosylamine--glycine ligase